MNIYKDVITMIDDGKIINEIQIDKHIELTLHNLI